MGLPRFIPPRPRHHMKASVNTMDKALKHASCLLPYEIADTMAPARYCTGLLRECKATEDHLIILRTQLRIAVGIEESGIVRGFRAEFESALVAIDAIETRSTAGGAWRQSALYAHELASIREAVRWHAFQLQHVSAGELHAAATKLIAQTRSSGGELRICGSMQPGREVTT